MFKSTKVLGDEPGEDFAWKADIEGDSMSALNNIKSFIQDIYFQTWPGRVVFLIFVFGMLYVVGSIIVNHF